MDADFGASQMQAALSRTELPEGSGWGRVQRRGPIRCDDWVRILLQSPERTA